MNKLLEWLVNDWQRKVIALITATIAWFFISQSIFQTKTLMGVPIRVVNLPANKTIEGLLPNGILNKRVTLTLEGTKKVIDHLGPDDLEIMLDAENAPNEWLVQITKNNLMSLNPKFNLHDSISKVEHQEFMIKLTRLITAQIPIEIEPPLGNLPRNYLFLGYNPQSLYQIVSGPEEQIEKMRIEGINLQFNLDEITKAELSELEPIPHAYSDDVVMFKVPDAWKKIYIPFMSHPWQTINDPNANNLIIMFLRKKFISLEKKIPLRVYYPLESSAQVNPKNYSLVTNNLVVENNGIYLLNVPLFAYEVSQLFIDIVRDNMEISIIAQPEEKGKELKWSIEFIEPQLLEDRFVTFLGNYYREHNPDNKPPTKQQIDQWRIRFRNFMQNTTLYLSPSHRLDLKSYLSDHHILVEEAN